MASSKNFVKKKKFLEKINNKIYEKFKIIMENKKT